MLSPLTAVRAALAAYARKDRTAIEALIARDYRFTSPMDNGLDRDAYFAICWPNSETMKRADIIHGSEDRERAFVVYEAENSDGKRFRNCELHHVVDGRIVETEVYFGWNLPHPVPEGEHRTDGGKSEERGGDAAASTKEN